MLFSTASLTALRSAVSPLVSCSSGVTFNLRQKMEKAKEVHRPRAVVVTHLDGENTDFDETVEEIRAAIGEVCVPVLLPDASGAGFSSVRRTFEVEDSEWRQRLMDRVMDACEDEELLMEYLESSSLTEEQLEQLMPVAIEKGALIPVLVANPDNSIRKASSGGAAANKLAPWYVLIGPGH